MPPPSSTLRVSTSQSTCFGALQSSEKLTLGADGMLPAKVYLPASATESGRIGTPASVETVRRVARGEAGAGIRGGAVTRSASL